MNLLISVKCCKISRCSLTNRIDLLIYALFNIKISVKFYFSWIILSINFNDIMIYNLIRIIECRKEKCHKN